MGDAIWLSSHKIWFKYILFIEEFGSVKKSKLCFCKYLTIIYNTNCGHITGTQKEQTIHTKVCYAILIVNITEQEIN